MNTPPPRSHHNLINHLQRDFKHILKNQNISCLPKKPQRRMPHEKKTFPLPFTNRPTNKTEEQNRQIRGDYNIQIQPITNLPPHRLSKTTMKQQMNFCFVVRNTPTTIEIIQHKTHPSTCQVNF
jgi:hypothetical protein